MMNLFFSYVAHQIGAQELAVELKELAELVKDLRKMAKDERDAMREFALGDRAAAYGARRYIGRNPREICALVVIEAWTLVHGEPPGAHDVQGICDTYWRACGIAPIGKRGDPENWRRTISAALQDNSAMRQRIRNQLQRRVVQDRS
jgi:hypothetical protein